MGTGLTPPTDSSRNPMFAYGEMRMKRGGVGADDGKDHDAEEKNI